VATTGALFHDPSSGMASSVFPRFHPGLRPAYAADAVTGVKTAVQAGSVVVTAFDEVKVEDDADDDLTVEEEEEALLLEILELVFVERLDEALVLEVAAFELEEEAVPGIHWE